MAFLQQDAKVYIASAGATAAAVVQSANEIGKINGQVSIDLTWEFATSRWRTRAIQDHDAFAVDGSITAEEFEWRATSIAEFVSNLTTGSQALYGTTLALNVTANYKRFTISTVPTSMQWCFQFRRTDDDKLVQVYAPKAKLEAYPLMFAGDDHTKHTLTWRLLASTNGKLIEVQHAVSSAGAPG